MSNFQQPLAHPMLHFQRFVCATCLSLFLASPVAGQTSDAPEITTRFKVPNGLEVKVWARSPMLFNPTNIDVDSRGRIWVSQAVNYRDFRNKQGTNPDIRHHAKGDRIMILEDTNGDGSADSSKVFVEDEDLVAPMGLSVIGNRVFVSCSPHLIEYVDTNGDDKADQKNIFLTGFGGHNHDHSLHTLVGGPDGRFYFSTGNTGPHIVSGSDGWTLRAGSGYNGGSPSNSKNKSGLVSDDGKKYVSGLAVRLNSDGSEMSVVGQNFRNPYEVAVDSFGDIWQNDNDDTISCRVTWLMEGGNLGFASTDGTRGWQADQRPGQTTQTAHWRQDDPGILPAGDIYGSGAPTGLAMYENGSLGADWNGTLLSCDSGRNCVWGYRPNLKGAAFELQRFKFMEPEELDSENSGARWFRPSDITVGTDGCLYVADWFDPAVGGHRQADNAATGCIYRIAPANSNPTRPKVDLTSRQGQLAALNSPATHVRFAAATKLREEGAAAVADLEKQLHDKTAAVRARAVWILASIGEAFGEAVNNDPDPRVRIAVLRALFQSGNIDTTLIENAAQDNSPAVRREAALIMAKLETVQPKAIAKLFVHYDGTDRHYLEALGHLCDHHPEAAGAFHAALPDVDPLTWSPARGNIEWRLQKPSSIEAFRARALASNLSDKQRRQAIDALAFINHQAAAEALFDIVLSKTLTPPLQEYSLWWVRQRITTSWKRYNLASRIAKLPKPDGAGQRAKSGSVKKRLTDTSAPLAQKKALINEWALDASGGAALLHLTARGEIPEELKSAVAASIFRNPDFSVRTLASQFYKRPGKRKADLPSLDEIAQLKGDPTAGESLFTNKDVACSKCHKFRSKGGEIGPDLTNIRTKFDRKRLLDSILNPSAAILVGYESFNVLTVSGRVVSGLRLSDADPVLIKDTNGKVHSISKDDIEEIQQQNVSLMPEDIATQLTPQQLADLVSFLQSK